MSPSASVASHADPRARAVARAAPAATAAASRSPAATWASASRWRACASGYGRDAAAHASAAAAQAAGSGSPRPRVASAFAVARFATSIGRPSMAAASTRSRSGSRRSSASSRAASSPTSRARSAASASMAAPVVATCERKRDVLGAELQPVQRRLDDLARRLQVPLPALELSLQRAHAADELRLERRRDELTGLVQQHPGARRVVAAAELELRLAHERVDPVDAGGGHGAQDAALRLLPVPEVEGDRARLRPQPGRRPGRRIRQLGEPLVGHLERLPAAADDVQPVGEVRVRDGHRRRQPRLPREVERVAQRLGPELGLAVAHERDAEAVEDRGVEVVGARGVDRGERLRGRLPRLAVAALEHREADLVDEQLRPLPALLVLGEQLERVRERVAGRLAAAEGPAHRREVAEDLRGAPWLGRLVDPRQRLLHERHGARVVARRGSGRARRPAGGRRARRRRAPRRRARGPTAPGRARAARPPRRARARRRRRSAACTAAASSAGWSPAAR